MSRTFDLFLNPRCAPGEPYGPAERAVLNRDGFEAARREIASWPGYAPTPLVSLPGLAAEAGVGAIHYKDESGRFGLGSFKALGGAYAVFRLLAQEIGLGEIGEGVTSAGLVAGRYREAAAAITVCCATDGNHGRSVAWGAQTFGCRCIIYIHATVSEGRRDAIASFGAEVVRVTGNYDDSVRQAAEDSARNGWHVVSDTSYDGYMEVPRQVMQGYTVMVDEAMGQLPGGEPPSQVFIQAGVGGLAAAVCAHMWESWGDGRPRFVVVEPENAACVFETARNGRLTAIPGDLDTMMAGLAAGEVSLLAWPILERGVAAFMTVPDAAAAAAMKRLAQGTDGDPPVVAGESAVAGLAGLLAAASDAESRQALGLDATSRVLLVGSEGDTDPDVYRRITGLTATQVRASAGE